MYFKLYEYALLQRKSAVRTDQHYRAFETSRGLDDNGEHAPYRKRRDAILMHLVGDAELFTGLVGRHSEERDVTKYLPKVDEARRTIEIDDDYPHAIFVCKPAISMIACSDSGTISANAAISRLHAILAHRTKLDLTFFPVRQGGDLQFATKKFKVAEVAYELVPVNPHTGDLGRQLDEANKKDHIRRSLGKLKAGKGDKLELKGGYLSQIHQLQKSGHARVGYTAHSAAGDEIKVDKPKEPLKGTEPVSGGTVPDLRLKMEGPFPEYPLGEAYIDRLVDIMKRFAQSE